MEDNWCHLSTFKFWADSSWGQMTGQIINRDAERGRETPSLDGVFRDPDLLCSLPGLQVIKSTNYGEPCKIWDESGVKQTREEAADLRQINGELVGF